MGRGRPGGNPEFGKTITVKTSSDNPTDEPFEILSVRVEPSLLRKIKSGDRWAEAFRKKLREIYADAD